MAKPRPDFRAAAASLGYDLDRSPAAAKTKAPKNGVAQGDGNAPPSRRRRRPPVEPPAPPAPPDAVTKPNDKVPAKKKPRPPGEMVYCHARRLDAKNQLESRLKQKKDEGKIKGAIQQTRLYNMGLLALSELDDEEFERLANDTYQDGRNA